MGICAKCGMYARVLSWMAQPFILGFGSLEMWSILYCVVGFWIMYGAPFREYRVVENNISDQVSDFFGNTIYD